MNKLLITYQFEFMLLERDSFVQYNTLSSLNSSVTILAGSLQANQTYRFKVFMQNRQDHTLTAEGYLIVNVEDTIPSLIAVA